MLVRGAQVDAEFKVVRDGVERREPVPDPERVCVRVVEQDVERVLVEGTPEEGRRRRPVYPDPPLRLFGRQSEAGSWGSPTGIPRETGGRGWAGSGRSTGSRGRRRQIRERSSGGGPEGRGTRGSRGGRRRGVTRAARRSTRRRPSHPSPGPPRRVGVPGRTSCLRGSVQRRTRDGTRRVYPLPLGELFRVPLA